MLADWGDGPEDYGRMGIPAWREAYGDDTDSGGKKKVSQSIQEGPV